MYSTFISKGDPVTVQWDKDYKVQPLGDGVLLRTDTMDLIACRNALIVVKTAVQKETAFQMGKQTAILSGWETAVQYYFSPNDNPMLNHGLSTDIVPMIFENGLATLTFKGYLGECNVLWLIPNSEGSVVQYKKLTAVT